jgi:hypothetical protein
MAQSSQSSPAGNLRLPHLPKWPIVRSVPPDGAEGEPFSEGPVITFTLQIPFPLGFKDDSVCIVQPFASWADSGAASLYGEKPFVVLRFCNVPIDDYDPYPQRGAEVLKKHYGFTSEEDESKGDDQSSSDAVYEQWVSMETPNVRLDNEEPLDEAFAFHRCLQVLSDLLRAHNLVYHDHRVRPITTYDVGAVVFMGEFKQHGETVAWELVRPIYMHPHRYFRFQANRDIGDDSKQLVVAYNQLKDHPFNTAREWYRRAEYAREYSGDSVDVVVSLQTSMESMLYSTWRMLLVDQGKSSVQISNVITPDSPYRPLLVRHLSQLLGGRWDTDAIDTTVGKYWHRLYLLRNRTVHGGYHPSWADGEAAYDAYKEMRDFVNERLRQRYRTYPRTLLAKLGGAGLRRRGWSSEWMESFIKQVESEPGPFYLPHDQRTPHADS